MRDGKKTKEQLFRKLILSRRRVAKLENSATERKRAEEALKREKEFSDKIINSSLDGIVAFDRDCRYIVWNPGMERIIGISKEGMLGRCAFDVFPFLKGTGEDRFFFEALAGKTAVAKNRPYVVPETGRYGFFDGYYSPLLNELGEIIGGLAIIHDITERKRAEDALRESEKTIRALLDATQDAVILLDANDTTFLALNEAMACKIGMNEKDAVGTSIRNYYPAEVNSRRQVYTDEAIHTGKSIHFEDEHEGRYFEHSIFPVFGEQGRTTRLAIYIRDITIRKEAEEKIHIYQEQLRSLVSELSLVEEQEKRSIATDLHDHIGQTLALTKIKLGSLQEMASSTELAMPVNQICDMIDQTIQYTRTLTFELSPPILYELGFEAAVEWLTEQIQEQHGILVALEDDRQPKPMSNEIRILLFKAVRELLINIVKHAQARKAKVSIRRDDDNIHILVEDDGFGFYSSKDNQSVRKSGFGLFSIRERLKHFGGNLEIESNPGHGTRVTLVAPLKR